MLTKTLLAVLITFSLSASAQIFVEGAHFPGEFPSCAAFGDLNNDGFVDLVQGNARAEGTNPLNASKIWLNNGDSTFTLHDEVGDRRTNEIELVDIDNDGDLDFVEGNVLRHQLWINDGQANFIAGEAFFVGDVHSLAIADYNEDGLLDIFFGNRELGTNDLYFINLGDGQFEFNSIPWTSGSRTTDCDAVDINMDGHMDIVMSKSMVGVPSLMENEVWFGNGDGTFIKSVQIFPLSSSLSLDVVDWDDDGFLDLIFREDGGLYIYYGNSSFIYNQRTLLFTDPIIMDYDFVDIDVDGDLDLVIGRFAGVDGHESEIFLNDGAGNFTDGTETYSMADTQEVEPFDIDMDGDIDLLNINVNFEDSVFWMNQTDPPLSLEDTEASKLSWYPNPVKNKLNINFSAGNTIQYFELFDVLGTSIIRAENNHSELSLDLAHLASGVYFGQVTDEQANQTIFRIIKN